MMMPAVQDHPQTAHAAAYASTEDAVSDFIATGPSVRSARTHAARKGRAQAVRRLDTTFGGLAGWHQARLDVRLGAPVEVRGLVIWLALATATPLDPRFVARTTAGWGQRLVDLHPALAARFTQIASSLGFCDQQTRRQWAVLAQLVAVTGVPPEHLHRPVFNTARDLIGDALQAARGGLPNTWTTPLHGLQASLSALEILDTPDGKRVPDRGRPGHWEDLTAQAPEMTATMRRYLTQLKISMRAGSVALIDTTLRHLAAYLTQHHRDVQQVHHVRRTHLEGFKVWLASRPGYRGRHGPAKTTIGMRLGHLRCFFDRIIEWGYDDAPARNPVFAGDMPIRDRPLPRFLDDPDATKLLSAARRLPALFDRVCVEVLARTGLRKGEFLGLTTDAVVTVGQGEWLRTPIGKLHNDRYIPLHPRVKTLLGQWLAQRADQPSQLMFVDHGRRIPQTRVDGAVRRAAAEAGIGHVTPHQLRHTLATQAINRGMSLEAIAALLGHKSMSMTMTYAKIADRTLADEYFAVTEKVESLYDTDSRVVGVAGPNMQRLHAETTRRLLGNGYCGRPEELGCRYEAICESCTFFTTTIEYRDQIEAQHADAGRHHDTDRESTYRRVLDTLTDTGT
jgi:site-specific recombinase XerD